MNFRNRGVLMASLLLCGVSPEILLPPPRPDRDPEPRPDPEVIKPELVDRIEVPADNGVRVAVFDLECPGPPRPVCAQWSESSAKPAARVVPGLRPPKVARVQKCRAPASERKHQRKASAARKKKRGF